jgi:hypothetical protein
LSAKFWRRQIATNWHRSVDGRYRFSADYSQAMMESELVPPELRV